MVLWFISGAALVLAAAASLQAVRVSKRLARMSQSYWDLRYDHERLRARVEGSTPVEPVRQAARPQEATTFVPLSSVRR
jgi:hypothetical protein